MNTGCQSVPVFIFSGTERFIFSESTYTHRCICFHLGNVLLQMCRPQPYMLYNKSVHKTGFQSMFNKDLTPMYNGRVLMNKTAMQDPVVKATLDAMAKRNFEPQRLNAYGVWYISDRH